MEGMKEEFMKRRIQMMAIAFVMALSLIAAPAVTQAADTDNQTPQQAQDAAVQQSETETKTALEQPVVRTTVKGTRVIQVSWNRVKGAKKYHIYRARKNGSYKKIKTTKKKTYTNKKLTRGTHYMYKVKAVGSVNGVSGTSVSQAKAVKAPKKLTWQTKGFTKTHAYRLMKICRSKLGNPYVSGGSGPTVFDCSGYAAWCANRCGVSGKRIIRTDAAGERNQLRKYSIGRSYKNAQPGDLVFIGSGGSITHVAFYYGNNKLIHATNPSNGVAITSIYWSGGPSRVVDIVRLPNM